MAKKILLVEDDPFLIDIYSTKLKESGFQVLVLNKGEGVVSKVKEENPDLLLLDIVLPEVDGWEILKKIKSEDKFKKLKVIILSNLGQKEEVERGMDLGAVSYLIKAQYTPSQVVSEVKKVLDEG